MNNNIGIIGYGNMGQAISGRLKSQYRIFVFDKEKSKTAGQTGLKACADLKQLALSSEAIILAVKPQDFDPILKGLKGLVKDKLIISIAAGISTKHIERSLGNVRVIRVMPNLGVRIGESVTCLCRGSFCTDEDLELANEIFYNLGVVRDISEDLMDAATAISGSGPAYIFHFLENSILDPFQVPEHARHDVMKRLEKAAGIVGFELEDAAFLAINTANTSFSLLKATRMSPAELRQQVTSKGGTTEAALKILIRGGSWDEAAQAALKRAKELAKR